MRIGVRGPLTLRLEDRGPRIETREPRPEARVGLTLTLTLTLTSTQEDGAGWAAQRTGRRLVVSGLEALGATGRPSASTPVATRPPGI